MSEASGRRSIAVYRLAIAGRLRARRAEIDEAVIHRTFSVAPATGREAPGYVEALRAAIPSAVDYAFSAIEFGEERTDPTPAAIFVQTAASARSGVGLATVVRRYTAGYSTLCDFLHQEVLTLGAEHLSAYATLQRDLTALFERLLVDVTDTYRREEEMALRSSDQRKAERIRRLLAGELVDHGGLDYALEGSHVALVASGRGAEEAAGELARSLDRRILIDGASEERCAAWLGGGRPLVAAALEGAAREAASRRELRISIGEPGEGLAGWRRSRRQAEAADLVARRSVPGLTCYRDVALIAAALRDPDLAHFLEKTYLDSLEGDRFALKETVAAFLAASQNASSAGAALGITRQTVTSRLRLAEEKLGRPLEACIAQVQTALRLADLGD